MLHLKPIPQKNAQLQISQLYKDIAHVFSVDTVPLPFQYLANFPDFFTYVWQKSVQNLRSVSFERSVQQVIGVTEQATATIYTPSESLSEFVAWISPTEKAYLEKTTRAVMQMNAQLLILSIGIRENIKGVFIGQNLLSHSATPNEIGEEELATQSLIKPYTPRDVSKPHELSAASTSAFLAPLFSSGLAVSSLPQFFASIDTEMHRLFKTEAYLAKRVLLEQQAMQASYSLQYPLGASYQEILRLAGGKPYFYELLRLLVETFPTAYPRMLFTTCVMHQSLKGKHAASTSLLS